MKKVALSNLVFVAALIVISCSKKPLYEKLENGVIIHLETSAVQPVKLLRLRVLSDKIIHVEASPSDSLPTTKSLAVIDTNNNKTVDWQIKEHDGVLTLSTPLVKANVSLTTGELVFTDSAGNVILQESKEHSKTFTETQIEGLNSYSIRQIFDSPDDEAFYGLGGYQNGQMNYKGEDVDLTQHNIIDVIPFLYSSKNYGILWDNYSISKFGDPREYQPLSSLHLLSKDGKSAGLTADYYVEDKIVKSKIEAKIENEFLETVQVDSFPRDVAGKGKVVWEGSFTSDKEGNHKFIIYASGYFKVWVDGKIIMDKWRQGWNPAVNKFKVETKRDEKHSLKIEWIPDGGAYIAVKHLDPLADPEQKKLSISSEVGDAINYYFVKGENADEVISGYRELTGKACIVPKWAMGYWQSRERYKTQKELLDVVKEYRTRNIPLDNIVLDWQYWEVPKWGSHEFDTSRFPDPAAMIKALHEKFHANLMISVWPKFYKGTANYDEMNNKGFLFTRNIKKKRKDWVGIGYESTFYDPFNAKAGELFWKQIDKHLNVLGIDAWWLDATEPDMHSNLSVDERKLNMSPTALGPGAKYFNAYSLMNSKSVYEGQRASSPDKRVFILTRSAFAGQQRYGAATWSGDIVSRWSDFQDQIATGINFSLSGIPYWTMDIGGFAVERRYEHASGETLNEWRELNTRWFQFGAFCPIFRSHGQFPLREIFNIAPENSATYKSMVYYDKLRYRLMPYLYSLAGQSYFNNATIMRGLVMDFNSDVTVRNIADQYMFGPALLINPVYTYHATEREIYLPNTTGWYDLYTGKYFNGGQKLKVSAPIEQIPVFVKEGSIIPVGPEIQYATEKSDPLTLYIYGGRNGSFTLYEDEGVNYNYEKGNYSNISFSYNDQEKTLVIGERNGSFASMLQERIIQIVLIKNNKTVSMNLPVTPDQIIKYTGKLLTVKL